jgi:hypothetical protein
VANARVVAQAEEGEEREATAAAGGGGDVPRRRGEHLGAALRGQVSIACSAPPLSSGFSPLFVSASFQFQSFHGSIYLY